MKKLLAGLGATLVLGGGGIYGADQAINPYEDLGDKYKLEIVSDIPQGERVEIHKDKAQMDLIGWNSEYKISVIPQIPTANLGAVKADKPFAVEADRKLLSKKMEYKSGDVTAFIEPKEGTQNEFDIDFTLDSQPNTNVFEYKIEGAEEFDFFYQPELTQQEIDEGESRPENVVGSYAVYHKTKANHRIGSTNYATGKAFHIYRPKAIDANGTEVWAELNYDNGTLSVTVPQKFLDAAAYPVRVDPTFGKTAIGGSTRNIGTNNSGSITATAPEDATLDSISIYVKQSLFGTGNAKPVIWLNSTKVIVSNGIAASVSINTTAGWRTGAFSVAPSVTASTDYYVGAVFDGASSGALFYYDASTGACTESGGSNNYTTPENLGTCVVTTDGFSTYATYTASAGAGTASPSSFYIKNGGLYVKDGGLYIKK